VVEQPAPAVETTPVVETPAAAPVTEAPAAVVEAPAVEQKPEVQAEAPKPAEEPVAPTYTEFKIPENVEAPKETISAYTNVLGKYKIPQEAGQELLDFHATQMKAAQTAMAEHQQQVFDDTQRKWRANVDKEFGNQRDTVVNECKQVISQYAGNKKQLREVWDVLAFTGAGNHPAVIRMFRNINKALNEGRAPAAGAPGNPNSGLSAADRRYGRRN